MRLHLFYEIASGHFVGYREALAASRRGIREARDEVEVPDKLVVGGGVLCQNPLVVAGLAVEVVAYTPFAYYPQPDQAVISMEDRLLGRVGQLLQLQCQ